MSLPTKAIDRLFDRLMATYGKQFSDMYASVDPMSVRTIWAHELAVYAGNLHRIAWALENLPGRCPNVIEFRSLCRQAPSLDVPALPEPKADPVRLKTELSKLSILRQATHAPSDHKAWAKKLKARHDSGDKLNQNQIRCYRAALGIA